MDEGEAVDEVGEPLTLLFPRHVEPPDGVVEGFAAHGHFVGEGLFAEVHDGAAHLEVAGKVVLEVEAQHRLALHAVVGVRFERAVDGRAGIKDTLVENFDDARIVVDGVVRAFGEALPSGRHHHAALWDVGSTELDFIVFRSLVLPRDDKLVVLRNLSGDGVGGVVKFGVGVTFRDGGITNDLGQMATERFDHGEIDTAVVGVDGVALDKVKIAVGAALVAVVQFVQSHETQ